MKAKATRDKPPVTFAPVKVELTFETKEELMEFYSLFNYCPVTEAVSLDDDSIRRTIEDATVGVVDYYATFDKVTEKIASAVKTIDQHEKNADDIPF
jgi:hypothetical protein